MEGGVESGGLVIPGIRGTGKPWVGDVWGEWDGRGIGVYLGRRKLRVEG